MEKKQNKISKTQRLLITLLIVSILAPTQMAKISINPIERETRHIYQILTTKKSSLSSHSLYELSKTIVEESFKYDLDPRLVLAVIAVESTFRVKARSYAGALGLMQIRPFVAEPIAEKLGLNWEGPETLYDPHANVRIGTYYLAKLQRRFDKETKVSLAAYNYGPTAISKILRHGKTLPTFYAKKVLAAYEELI
jgi:soluble lytic murein transglycosylase-like protein